MPPLKLSRRTLLRAATAAFLSLPGALALDALWLEPRWLRVRHLALAPGFPRTRLVHFSDLHHKGDRGWLDRVVSEINALNPAFVCFTGDLVEEARHLPDALRALQAVRAPLFGVPGNHDHWSGADFAEIGRCFARSGGAWLVNDTAIAPGGTLQIVGIDRLDAVPAKADTIRRIVLMHYPLWAERLAGQRYDLLMAGHSHGGQVRIPFLGAPVVPFDVGRYVRGLYQTPAGPLHVSPGIGTLHINARLACRPEITVLEV